MPPPAHSIRQESTDRSTTRATSGHNNANVAAPGPDLLKWYKIRHDDGDDGMHTCSTEAGYDTSGDNNSE